jgi:hypothetical protein
LEALNVHLASLSLAEDASMMSLAKIMRKEEYLTKLIGVLTKFTKDQSDLSPGDDEPLLGDEFSIVLNDTVAVEIKAIVYEAQVHILLGMTYHGQYEAARKICHQILDMYAQCPLRRVRVVERLLYLAIVEGNEVEDILALGSDAITTLTSTKVFLIYSRLTLDIW